MTLLLIFALLCATRSTTALLNRDEKEVVDNTNLKGVRALAISPDGKNVYGVSYDSNSIVHWDRDSTGTLTNQVSKIDSVNLYSAMSVAISSDGKNVYAVAEGAVADDSYIVHWDRSSTGALTNQVNLPIVVIPMSVTVSPDGKNVYVVTHDGSMIHWVRNLNTGALTSQVNAAADNQYYSSVIVSPDNQNVYAVAGMSPDSTPNSKSIVHWDRNLTTGALTNKVSTTKSYLDAAQDVTISPDGKHVYAASWNYDGIIYWNRDLITGALTSVRKIKDTTRLFGVSGVTVSPDGKKVYAVSTAYQRIVYWDRDSTTGELSNEEISSEYTESLSNAGYDVIVSPDNKNVYVAAYSSNSIVYFTDSPSGNEEASPSPSSNEEWANDSTITSINTVFAFLVTITICFLA